MAIREKKRDPTPDATNFVEVGSTTGVYDIKLLAGEFALYRHNSATVYAKADEVN